MMIGIQDFSSLDAPPEADYSGQAPSIRTSLRFGQDRKDTMEEQDNTRFLSAKGGSK